MHAGRIISAAIATFALYSPLAHAQSAINVRKEPPPAAGEGERVVYDRWVGSWGLRDHAPDEYPLGTSVHSTEGAARASAQAHMARTRGNGAQTVTHYLIVGEPSLRRTDGPTYPDNERFQTEAMNQLADDTRQTLRDWIEEDTDNAFGQRRRALEDVINRVREFREYATRNVDRLAEEDFQKINAMIDGYNKNRDTYRTQQHGEYFSGLPRLTPLVPGTLKDTYSRWKIAADSEVDLRPQKAQLDADKERLDDERARLIEQGRDDRAEQQALAKLRLSLPTNRNNGPPYHVWGWTTKTATTGRAELLGAYQVLAAAQRAMRDQNNSGFRGRNHIDAYVLDKSGRDVSRETGEPESSPDDAELKRREEDLARRHETRRDALNRYKGNLQRYENDLREFEGRIRSHKAKLGGLSDLLHKPADKPH